MDSKQSVRGTNIRWCANDTIEGRSLQFKTHLVLGQKSPTGQLVRI